ncbi:MAG: chitobiase/beta-hexosaminidase C-terminal domain-containing protein, partial [Kiritimatiellia bacterium]
GASGADGIYGANTAAAVQVDIAVRRAAEAYQVRYAVDGVALRTAAGEWAEIVFPEGGAEVVAAGCYGAGEITTLTGATELEAPTVELTIPALEGMTVASVTSGGVALTGEGGAYAVPQGNTVVVTFAPADGYVLDGGVMVFPVRGAGELPAEGRPRPVRADEILSINEVMASNGSTAFTARGGAGLDWIEIRNAGDFDVDITGWRLHDAPADRFSKWQAIQGRCVVPAHGYRIVWADKAYADFAADEAYTRIGLSTAGEPLVLATPGGTVVDEVANFGKQIKDVSIGLGHVERVALPADAEAEYRVGSGAWKPVQGAIGMSAAQSGFTCVTYFANTTVNNTSDAERFAADPAYWARPPVTNVCETIAFTGNNGGTVGDFAYSGFPGGCSDNMVMVVTGSVYVPRAGQWTFAAGSDDGFTATLSRLGLTWTWEYPNNRSHAETFSTFSLPAAGAYDLRLVYFDKSGGKTIDVSVRDGACSFADGGFKLLGGAESGVVHAGAFGGSVAADLAEEMKGRSVRADWRADFTLAEAPAAGDAFRLRMRYADGFTAKVNGTQVAAVAATAARPPAEALTYSYFEIPSDLLKAGVNRLEVTGVNNALDDGEFFLSPEVVWTRGAAEFVYFRAPTPGAANGESGLEAPTPEVQFSVPHGYKTAAFDLALACAERPSAPIYYTLDGTSPTRASARYTGPIRIAHTTVVRAAVPNAASVLQCDASATYLFVDEVLAQPATAPEHFPTNKQVNGQAIAYEMNPQIVAQNRARILRGFTNSIATLSLVIDPEHLFDSSKGIYVNASGNGRAWERPTLVELITPTNAPDEFSVPAGLRIRGAFSRGAQYPKHSLRLFFRSEYGMGTLNHPLFGDEGASKFDKIDLRTAQNNSWSNNDGYSTHFTFIEECFSRDSQRDLGEPYNRSRYYNLFINGVYWGVYQTEERVSGDYGETYFGGVAEDYDVVRTSNPGYVTGVVEGTDDGWHDFWNLSVNEGYGPDHPDNYLRAQGLNPDGSRNAAYPIYLNPRNVMVHMLTTHYTADQDAPAAGDKANNMAALCNRVNSGTKAGWVFNRHDAEHSLGRHGTSVANDRTLFGTEAANANFLKEAHFNPAELNYRLMTNAEYRTAFGDLVYRECLRAGGALTPERAKARFEARMRELEDAVACESARWGWGKYTCDTWASSCAACLTFMDERLKYLIPHYRKQGWYPSIDPPAAVDGLGAPVADGSRVAFDGRVYLTGGASGTIYYTTDGSDPRLAGGAVSARAAAYTGGSPTIEYAPVFGRASSWDFFDWGAEPAR